MNPSGDQISLNEEISDCLPPPLNPGDSLSTLMLHGWFNDQVECTELFLRDLDPEIRESWAGDSAHRDELKRHYSAVFPSYQTVARRRVGEHKLLRQLDVRDFAWWVGCVFRSSSEAGSLEALMSHLRTVESAHETFKRWFVPGGNVKSPRILNAADAARLLARAGWLLPEERPLLARGALRGAAMVVDGADVPTIDAAEEQYPGESSRRALEDRAATFAQRRWGNDVPMAQVETWFCERVHKTH